MYHNISPFFISIMKFQISDAGRSLSKRPKQKNDCTVRALSLVLDLSYDNVYEFLASEGRSCSKRFKLKEFLANEQVLSKIQSLTNFHVQWRAFQAVKGKPRMNPPQFTLDFPQGKYILKTAGHVFAVIDGTVFDTVLPRSNRCVYGCWSFFK